MCWKQEWAAAFGNCRRAITHIKRAQAKLQERRRRNEKYLKWLDRNKHKSSPKLYAEARRLLVKNSEGMFKCELAIKTLRDIQSELRNMIKTYGISHTSNPARTRELMFGKEKATGKVKE